MSDTPWHRGREGNPELASCSQLALRVCKSRPPEIKGLDVTFHTTVRIRSRRNCQFLDSGSTCTRCTRASAP